MRAAVAVAAFLAAYELVGIQLPEYVDRHLGYWAARAYCARVGKPLLRIGVHRNPLELPNGLDRRSPRRCWRYNALKTPGPRCPPAPGLMEGSHG